MTSARVPAEDPGSPGRIRAAAQPERTPRPRPLAEAERARAVLSLGILALRWVTLALMTLMAVITGDLQRPLLAGAAIAVTTAWTVWLTVSRPRGTAPVLATDLLPERALDGDESARTMLIEQVYEPLLRGGTALLDTVMTYLEQGNSLEATARLLFVHPNTVRYRLRRVNELTGVTASDGRGGFTLWTAVILGRLAHKRT